jgi:RND family efflux transporter MFP subunit
MKKILKISLPKLRFWHWPKKYLALLLIIFVAAGWFITANRHKIPESYKFTTVQTQNIHSEVSASGVINGQDSVNLKFNTSGKILFVNAKIGDQVKAGDISASLNTTSQNIALQQAQNTLRDKQATVDKIIDDIKQYQYGNQTNSSAETFTLRQNRTTAEVARDNAYDNVKAAQRAFQDAVITTPIDGTITSVPLIVGQNATITDTVTTLVDFTTIFFEAEVDESDINKISLGQQAKVTLNSIESKTFYGQVTQINPTTKTTTNGTTVIIVKIDLSNSGIQPIAGLNGQASIILTEKTNVLSIPQEAVRADNTVLVKTAQGIKPSKVTTGLKSDLDVEITSGLKVGDQIVTNPPVIKTK